MTGEVNQFWGYASDFWRFRIRRALNKWLARTTGK